MAPAIAQNSRPGRMDFVFMSGQSLTQESVCVNVPEVISAQGRKSQKSEFPRFECGLGAIQYAQFSEDVAEVIFDGSLGKIQNVGDLLVAFAFSEFPQNLAFTIGKRFA